jgi:manganese/iron transport system substrate-binding protein
MLGALAGGVALALGPAALAQPAIPPLPEGRRLRILATFTILADIARNVVGDRADVVSLLKPGAEVHGYQPTPGDLVRAQEADLVIANGMNLERWVDRFLGAVADVPSVVASEGIAPIPIGEGPAGGRPNPHAWMSPANGVGYVETIRAAAAARDPANAEAYAAAARAYAAELMAIDARLRDRFAAVPEERRWLVTSEGAFSYLARDYGLREAYLWPINADRQGTPQQIRRVIDLVRANAVPVVFSESTVSDAPARQVAAETGARYGGVLYVDSLSEADGPVPTYLKLLEVTTETIVAGFVA